MFPDIPFVEEIFKLEACEALSEITDEETFFDMVLTILAKTELDNLDNCETDSLLILDEFNCTTTEILSDGAFTRALILDADRPTITDLDNLFLSFTIIIKNLKLIIKAYSKVRTSLHEANLKILIIYKIGIYTCFMQGIYIEFTTIYFNVQKLLF